MVCLVVYRVAGVVEAVPGVVLLKPPGSGENVWRCWGFGWGYESVNQKGVHDTDDPEEHETIAEEEQA
jgi:hypothetical protein